jgi:predicted lipid-binding transport protein (Tim44 family)
VAPAAPAPFELEPLLAAARDAYLAVARALVAQQPDPARHLMTDACWEPQVRRRIETMQLDGSAQRFDRLMVTDARLRGWDAGAGDQHRAIVRLTLSGVRCVEGRDGRVLLGSPRPDQWAEDWRFVRSSDPAVLAAATDPRCPACGAPLQIDQDGRCAYCRAVVPGAKSDWLVDDIRDAVDDASTVVSPEVFQTVAAAAAEEAAEAPAGDQDGLRTSPAAAPALAAIRAADPNFDPADVGALARQAFLALDAARVGLAPEQLGEIVTPELAAREAARAAEARAAGRHDVPAFLDIDSVELVGAAVDAAWQQLVYRVHARSALHVIDLATGTVVGGEDTVRPWQADLTLVRPAGTLTDPYDPAWRLNAVS